MSWSLKSPQELTKAERLAWDRYQRANALTDSAYFRPEWYDALASVGRPVRVAVWSDSDGPQAFLGFEQHDSVAHPAGRMISDYQGLVGSEGRTTAVDVMQLLESEEISAWHFDHLLAAQPAFAPYHEAVESSPYIDLSAGLEAYQASLSKSGRSDASSARRKGRKLGREVGELKLTWRSTDRAALASLFEWKSAQYADTQVPDIFASDWTRDLLANLLAASSDSFAGVLTTLHAGDNLVAVHFGMQSGGVLHWWFPTYSPAFSQYSPGRVLLQLMIDGASDVGVQKIDLGKGLSGYKRRTMSGETAVAVGVVEPRSIKRVVRRSAQGAKEWLKKTPLRGPLTAPARWLHHYVSRRAMQ